MADAVERLMRSVVKLSFQNKALVSLITVGINARLKMGGHGEYRPRKGIPIKRST